MPFHSLKQGSLTYLDFLMVYQRSSAFGSVLVLHLESYEMLSDKLTVIILNTFSSSSFWSKYPQGRLCLRFNFLEVFFIRMMFLIMSFLSNENFENCFFVQNFQSHILVTSYDFLVFSKSFSCFALNIAQISFEPNCKKQLKV